MKVCILIFDFQESMYLCVCMFASSAFSCELSRLSSVRFWLKNQFCGLWSSRFRPRTQFSSSVLDPRSPWNYVSPFSFCFWANCMRASESEWVDRRRAHNDRNGTVFTWTERGEEGNTCARRRSETLCPHEHCIHINWRTGGFTNKEEDIFLILVYCLPMLWREFAAIGVPPQRSAHRRCMLFLISFRNVTNGNYVLMTPTEREWSELNIRSTKGITRGGERKRKSVEHVQRSHILCAAGTKGDIQIINLQFCCRLTNRSSTWTFLSNKRASISVHVTPARIIPHLQRAASGTARAAAQEARRERKALTREDVKEINECDVMKFHK